MVLNGIPYGTNVLIRVAFMTALGQHRIALRRPALGGEKEYVSFPVFIADGFGAAAFAFVYGEDAVPFTYTAAVDAAMADVGVKGWILEYLGLAEE
jgi:hypothetical protein